MMEKNWDVSCTIIAALTTDFVIYKPRGANRQISRHQTVVHPDPYCPKYRRRTTDFISMSIHLVCGIIQDKYIFSVI